MVLSDFSVSSDISFYKWLLFGLRFSGSGLFCIGAFSDAGATGSSLTFMRSDFEHLALVLVVLTDILPPPHAKMENLSMMWHVRKHEAVVEVPFTYFWCKYSSICTFMYYPSLLSPQLVVKAPLGPTKSFMHMLQYLYDHIIVRYCWKLSRMRVSVWLQEPSARRQPVKYRHSMLPQRYCRPFMNWFAVHGPTADRPCLFAMRSFPLCRWHETDVHFEVCYRLWMIMFIDSINHHQTNSSLNEFLIVLSPVGPVSLHMSMSRSSEILHIIGLF